MLIKLNYSAEMGEKCAFHDEGSFLLTGPQAVGIYSSSLTFLMDRSKFNVS